MVFVQLWRDGDVFALPSFWLHKTARFRSSSLPAGHGGKVREMGLAAESADAWLPLAPKSQANNAPDGSCHSWKIGFACYTRGTSCMPEGQLAF